jgi:S1-C subfamily serine protease
MRYLASSLVILLLFVSALYADQLTLKDGTVLEGTIVRQKDCYWVRTSNGQTRIVPFSDVQPPTSPKEPAPSKPVAPPKPVTPTTTPASESSPSASPFAAAKRQIETTDSPLAAVAHWQKFIDSNPSPSDLAAATAELEKWRKLADDSAERINGRWIGGAERRLLIDKANALTDEAADLIAKDQTLAAIKKLQDAVRTYPNSYQAVFSLGYLSLQSKNEADAIRYFEQGLKVRPHDGEALNNLGIAVLAKRDFARSIDLLYRAAEIADNRVLAQNLYNVVDTAPERLRNSPRYKAAAAASQLLAGKYSITENTRNFALIPPHKKSNNPEDELLAGVRSAGTGFVINADGLILTNRHVVEGAQALLVLLPGNIRRSAEVVCIDEDQDLALVRVKHDRPLPPVSFAKSEPPAEGAACFVMGYPLIDRMGASIKITQGIVSGKTRNAAIGVDIVVDAKVNPGNSGGPLLNDRGQVIGIVTMKSRSTVTEDSYGLAISTARFSPFLQKNNITLSPSPDASQVLTAEQIATRLKPSTVCILSVR